MLNSQFCMNIDTLGHRTEWRGKSTQLGIGPAKLYYISAKKVTLRGDGKGALYIPIEAKHPVESKRA
jgi:hypothetical protein